jgi:hypothetical protein
MKRPLRLYLVQLWSPRLKARRTYVLETYARSVVVRP